jgi:hypothetical protein
VLKSLPNLAHQDERKFLVHCIAFNNPVASLFIILPIGVYGLRRVQYVIPGAVISLWTRQPSTILILTLFTRISSRPFVLAPSTSSPSPSFSTPSANIASLPLLLAPPASFPSHRPKTPYLRPRPHLVSPFSTAPLYPSVYPRA